MAKGSVSDEELATGLKSFGGFGALGQASGRPRREDPFRDTRAEHALVEAQQAEESRVEDTPVSGTRVEVSEAFSRIEVVKTPPAEPPAPPAVRESAVPLKLREKKPAIPRLTQAERSAEPAPQPGASAAETKAALYTERVTVPLGPELRDAAEALAKDLQRRRTEKGERITANSVMRVALRVLLDAFDARSAGAINTEEELFEAASARLRTAKR